MHASSVLSVLQHVAVLAASAVAQYTQARCSTLKMRLACVLLLATHMHAHARTYAHMHAHSTKKHAVQAVFLHS